MLLSMCPYGVFSYMLIVTFRFCPAVVAQNVQGLVDSRDQRITPQ